MHFKKDTRRLTWAELENDIQKRATKKDSKFRLKGKWKKFLRIQDGLKIYIIDGEYIRNNLSVIYGHGGHGYVHEFIPLDEIWASTHHYDTCNCDNLKKKNQKCSKEYFESTIIHEIEEFKRMKKGMKFHHAHQMALKKEREVGLLKDPTAEN